MLIQDDCRAALRRLIAEGVHVHSVVTDPPYLLETVVKRFGKPNSAPAQAGSDGRFARQSKGFMGKKWDGADEDGTRIPQDPEFWKLVYDVLLPGGYVLAFSSPRTGHRQACAMEDAGFIMHPFLGWAYGTGFPKGHSVSKAIDRAAGAEREIIGTTKRRDIRNGNGRELGEGIHASGRSGPEYLEHAITKPATEESARWDGWFYGTQTLKPALEPVYVGQKPFSEKSGFQNVLEHGVGALNVDGCRVEMVGETSQRVGRAEMGYHGGNLSAEYVTGSSAGRWPANLVHDGSDDVLAAFPESKGQQGAITGDEPSRPTKDIYGKFNDRLPFAPRNDSGSAARFFYSSKASAKDRVIRCLVCGERFFGKPTCACSGKTTGHPTVKPISLMRWLCRLVTPPGGTILDPFAGTGTTGQAAQEEGFESILIERESEYADDIRFRLGLPDLSIEELLGFPLSADIEALL